MLLCAMTAVCGCGTVRGRPATYIAHTTPQALAASFHRAVESRDYAGMLECMEPSKQAQYDRLLVELRGFLGDVQELAGLVERKVGKEAADRLLSLARRQVAPSPFSPPGGEGNVDWGKVEFLLAGETAWARTGGLTWLFARRIGGEWFMTHDDTKLPFEQAVGIQQRTLATARAGIRRCADELRRGRPASAECRALWESDSRKPLLRP